MKAPAKLTKRQIKALRDINGGVGVCGAELASLVRSIQAARPELIVLTSTEGNDYLGAGPEPFYHADLTARGREYLKAQEGK
ncbi:hypothetical protein BH09VER1_BH09VER1_24860 [soil metagenome]